MNIIISPAKNMRIEEGLSPKGRPVFEKEAERLRDYLRALSYEEVKALWGCSDKIAKENIARLSHMDFKKDCASPAILSYDGIQFKYMAPAVFEYAMLDYVQAHLRILSGFYGVLRPMDGVFPYRLEMKARINLDGKDNLYDFWGDRLYRQLRPEDGLIINLASREYAQCISPYIRSNERFLSCDFCEKEGGKLVQKGVYAKIARGEMLRFMAENKIEKPEDMQAFSLHGYAFSRENSSENHYVFIRKPKP